jgi:PEP-CTERM motif
VPVAVPEPASVAMLGGGLTVIGALLRKLGLEKAD